MEECQPSSKKLQDSGLGLSLSCMPTTADAIQDLNASRESGEIVDDPEEELQVAVAVEAVKAGTSDTVVDSAAQVQSGMDNGYIKGMLYIPMSVAEMMVIQKPPVPPVSLNKLVSTPESRATIITDRVGVSLTKRDKVVFMQNNVAVDYWELARLIGKDIVKTNFRYIFVCLLVWIGV